MSNIRIEKDLDPVFNRDSIAYTADDDQVAADVARYDVIDGETGILIEPATTNLFSDPASPAVDTITVTPDADYALRFTTSGSGSVTGTVTIEHIKTETTTADFETGTLVNTQASGNLLTLSTAAADPTMTRATVASKRNGEAVSSNVPRYEDVVRVNSLDTQGDFDACAKIGPVVTSPAGSVSLGAWADGFDADTSWAYTSSTLNGTISSTYNTGSSRLEIIKTTGSYATLTYNDYYAKNASIEAAVSQAAGLGLLLRYQDDNNLYVVLLYDDTYNSTNNVYIYKRISGSWTELVGATDITFVRGTQYAFKFEIINETLKLYQDGVLIASAIDSSLLNAGKVGFYQEQAIASYVDSLTIDMATPLFARDSNAHNPDTGSLVTPDSPRYVRGRNLLSANQSSIEDNLVGVGGWSGGETITRDTSTAWHGSACIRCEVPDTGANKGFSLSVPVPVFEGIEYTFSGYVQGTGTVIARHSDALVASSAPVTLNLVAWQRISVTATATKGGLAVPGITTDVAQAITFYADGLQFEASSAATTWQLGGDSAILIEQATENLIFNGYDNPANWTDYGGNVTTVTSGQVDPFGGTGAYRIQTSGGSAPLKTYASGSGILVLGDPYATSIFINVNSAVDVTITSNGQGLSDTVSQTDGWKLVKLAGNGNGGSTQIHLLAPTAGDDIDCFVMWPQIEAGSFCTSYIAPGSIREKEKLFIPLVNFDRNNFVINTEFYVNNVTNPIDNERVFYLYIDSDNYIAAYHNYISGILAIVYNANGELDTFLTGTALIPGNKYNLAFACSGTNAKAYLNGAQIETTKTCVPLVGVIDGIYLGASPSSTEQLNGKIDKFAIFPILSDSELIALTSI